MVKNVLWLRLNGVLSVWLHLGSFSLFTLTVQMLRLMKQYRF